MCEMRNLRYLIAVVAAFVYFDGGRGLAAAPPPPICSEVCDSSTHCEETCYENMMEFENGNDITCLDYGSCDPGAQPEVCGNYFCGDGETYSNCPADCDLNIGSGPTCDNSTCETGEDSKNCNEDCVDQDECGDHVCDLGESAANCPGDCYQAGFCGTHDECQGEYGSGYICARQRCVYEPGAQWCDPQLQALDCPSPAMKCVNNVCVEVF
jgi:hypothetical protein